MTYDPVDTNDDGVVDADVDNDLVSTPKTATDQGTVWDRDSATNFIKIYPVYLLNPPTDTSDSGPTPVANGGGYVIDFADLPSGGSLYGRVSDRYSSGSDTDSATTQPLVRDSGGDATPLTELETTVTSSGAERVDTGWTEITSLSSGYHAFESYRVETDSGATFSGSEFPEPTIQFAWRLD